MLNSPRKVKFRKVQKGPIPNRILSKSENIIYGSFAFKAEDFGILTAKQLESARKVIMKKIKKKGKLWIRVFPHLPKTKKPVEVRMGKGKGAVDIWIAKIRPGTILYEIEGISLKLAKEIFYASCQKLPINCKLISF